MTSFVERENRGDSEKLTIISKISDLNIKNITVFSRDERIQGRRREDIKITVIKMDVGIDSLRFVEDTINIKFDIGTSTFRGRRIKMITDSNSEVEEFVKVQGVRLTVFIENLNIVRVESIGIIKFEEQIVDSITEAKKRGFIGIIVTNFVGGVSRRGLNILNVFISGEFKDIEFSEIDLVSRIHLIRKRERIIGGIKRDFVKGIKIEDKNKEINRFILDGINESEDGIIVRLGESEREDLTRGRVE